MLNPVTGDRRRSYDLALGEVGRDTPKVLASKKRKNSAGTSPLRRATILRRFLGPVPGAHPDLCSAPHIGACVALSFSTAVRLQLKPFDPPEQNLTLPLVAGKRRRSTEL